MDEKNRILNSGLLEQYVLGLLNPEEVYLVEKHLKDYPELHTQVEAIETMMQQVLHENTIAPPPELKENILSKIVSIEAPDQPNNHHKQQANTGNAWMWIVSTLAVLLAGSTFFFYQESQQQSNRLQALTRQCEQLQKDCSTQQKTLYAQYQFIKKIKTQSGAFNLKILKVILNFGEKLFNF
ncbi:MAG: hypothetical protein AAF738_08160 [Bacteroidota bacterium]